MIVRTYGRRNRPISRTCSESSLNDDVSDPFSLSQDSPNDNDNDNDKDNDNNHHHHHNNSSSLFAFSSQDSSSHWSLFDSDPNSIDDLYGGAGREPKRARRTEKKKAAAGASNGSCRFGISATTSTLMEAQEFGEMMEHVDEVNFALDGLRKGQPLRIRRASLVSLLGICGTTQQRRLIRSQGLAKTITDAVLGLSLDDSPSNLAAATLLYILTSNGQDDHLLESSGCIQFLIKLLRPIVSTAIEDKTLKFGSKLLSLRQNSDSLKNSMGRLDNSSVAILSRVQEVLVNCKELKTSCQSGNVVGRPELCSEWLALLTMEKACLSAISLDETSGTVRKAGGNFKEKLREHGGLDAVFEVTMNCHSDLEKWVEDTSLSTKDLRSNGKHLKNLTLLLKCLKIMENATFLSNDNQTHLLGLKRKLSYQAAALSFTKLIIAVIKILSDLCLRQSASATSNDKKPNDSFSMASHGSELDVLRDHKENQTLFKSSIGKSLGVERASTAKSSSVSQNSWMLTCSQMEISESPSTSTTDIYPLMMRVSSSTSGSCSGASKNSYYKTSVIHNDSRKNVRFTERTPVVILDDSQEDPFAFDEDDIAPSKWDLLSGKPQKSHSKKKYEVANKESEDGRQSQTKVCPQELNDGDINCSSSVIGYEEHSSLLRDCLHTAVKVLMNLTNDNPVGCQQIAAYGGLEAMSMLIAGHFPSFSSSSSFSQTSRITEDYQYDKHLTDQELDFLVAILGLLVNLVEKDDHNRSRLAAASVLLPSSKGLGHEVRRDVIQLLCSIFLANQGGSEGSGEDKHLTLDDEDAVLQGEKEAEKMIVEAYSALLLAFLSTESKSIRAAIADNLPEHSLTSLVPVLDRFVEFHLSLNMISPETHKTVTEVIESCRIP